MARVKYASLVSDISGSIGSATFQKSLYGNTLRSKPRCRKSGSASQQGIRILMMQCHQAWRSLSDAQRRQWNQFINYSGASINRDRAVLLTGHALFLKYNFLRLFAHLAIMTNPVYLPIDPWPKLYEVAFDENSMVGYFSDNTYSDNLRVIFAASPRRLPSLSFSPAGLRSFYNDGSSLSTCPFYPGFNTVFGAIPAVGQTIHYSFQFFSTLSPAISAISSGKIAITAYH
jgi:hypothetical protein